MQLTNNRLQGHGEQQWSQGLALLGDVNVVDREGMLDPEVRPCVPFSAVFHPWRYEGGSDVRSPRGTRRMR